MRKIIFIRADGGVSVVHPALNTLPKLESVTEAEAEQRAWDKLPTDAINPRFVNDADIPSDRTFRNAWTHDLTVDFPKAQVLTKDRLRIDRKPLLEAQDVLFQRALETGQDATAIVKEKQRLRDVTKLVDTATTLDALKNMGVA